MSRGASPDPIAALRRWSHALQAVAALSTGAILLAVALR